MMVYQTEITVRRKRREPEVRSISTLWLIPIAGMIYFVGFIASLV